MADSDRKFQIEVETIATGAGAEETEAKLARIKTVEQTAAIESQKQVIAQTRFDLTEAQVAGDEARIAILREELRIRTSVLGVMQAQTLSQTELAELAASEEVALGAAGLAGKTATEGMAAGGLLAGANLTKARQEATVLVRELTTGGNVMRTLGSLLSAFPGGITAAAIAGIGLYEGIKKTNAESEKLIGETKQLGDELANAVGVISNTASSGFNSTTPTKIGISFNGGSSFSGTNNIVQANFNKL